MSSDGASLIGTTQLKSVSIKLMAVLAVCAALYFGRSLFVPVVLAVVLALTLFPLIRAGQKAGLPPVVSALALMLAVTVCLVLAAASLSGPVSRLSAELPYIGYQLKYKLKSLREPLETIDEAGEQVEEMTKQAKDAGVQEVVIKQPGLVARAADDVIAMVATVLLALTLCFFLLVSRELFYRKVLRVMPTLSDKKRALQVAYDIEHDVSRYLLTVSAINAALGLGIGVALWLLGMPNPLLWGVLAGMLNFLPYIGAILGIVATGVMAIVSFPTLGEAAAVPAVYLVFTVLEGQFITPWLLGKRFSLNTVVILLSIAFWGFMWGAVGVFVAVPILIVLRVLCDRIDGLAALGEFVSGEPVLEEPAAAGEALKAPGPPDARA